MPSYDEKLDLILARLDAIESKIGAVPPPQSNDGLYWYKRPAAGVPRYGYGKRLRVEDITPEELRLRSLYCVKWNGDVARSGPYEDEVWAEIAALQSGDPGLIKRYEKLDPDVAGYCLLTDQFDPVKYDAISFGNNLVKRESFAGKTMSSIAEELAILLSGGSTPSGGGE